MDGLFWKNHMAVCLLLMTAFTCLSLSMPRHQGDLFGKELCIKTTKYLRLAGWILLLLALCFSVGNMGWSFGITAYIGHTSLAAGMVFVALIVESRIKARRNGRVKELV